MCKELEELENNDMNSLNTIDVVGKAAGRHRLSGIDKSIVIMTGDSSIGNKVTNLTNRLRDINDKKVTTLRLSNNIITSQDSFEIPNALRNSSIERLELHENNIEDNAADSFMKNLESTHIKHLRIRDYALNDPKKFPIHSLRNAKNIIKLEINMENLTAQYVVEILENLKRNITDLSIYKVNIGWDKMVDFGDALQSSLLTTLRLGVKIGDSGIRVLAKSLPGSNIKTLDLSNNNISDKGAEALVNILPNTNIKALFLNTNEIKEKAKDLVRLCVNGNLKSLHLRYNKIEDQEAEDIACILKNGNESHIITSKNDCGKKHINLRDNKIGHDGVKVIISVFNKLIDINTTHKCVEYYQLWSYLDKLENGQVHVMVDMYEVQCLDIPTYSDDIPTPISNMLY